MKIKNYEIDKFCLNFNTDHQAILIYGEDYGLKNERAGAIIKNYLDHSNNGVDLDIKSLITNPEVLTDELSSISLLADKKVIKIIKTMQDLGVNISHEEQISSSNEFQEMSFVITGKFSKFSRNELKGIIESKGGKVSGSISSKTNYLVLGEDPGSKLEKAQKLKIDILTEDDF